MASGRLSAGKINGGGENREKEDDVGRTLEALD